jgi:hypothetical protein
VVRHCRTWSGHPRRHCEKRSDEAIQISSAKAGLLRCARNDDRDKQKAPRKSRGAFFFNVDYREEDEEFFAHDLIRKPEDHFSGSCVIRLWQAWQRPTLPSLEA